MSAMIRFSSRREEGTVEMTIGMSKRVVVAIMVILLGAVSLGYAVLPVESQQQMGRGRKAINPNKNYSEIVEAGDFVFLSGMIATSQGKVIAGGIKEETRMVMDNLKTSLAKSGLTMDDVVKATVYLGKLDDYVGMNEVYQTYFTKDPPARSTVQSGVVLNAGVEIDFVAYRGGK
ncbi:MAG: RidA family protein [candidate division Zixibacteria bacterium]|nr:RidA family protein [candidate division Zixibacteria bacterium]